MPHFERHRCAQGISYKPFYFSKVAYVHGLLGRADFEPVGQKGAEGVTKFGRLEQGGRRSRFLTGPSDRFGMTSLRNDFPENGRIVLCTNDFPNREPRHADFPSPWLPFASRTHYTGLHMSLPAQPNVKLSNSPDYRESYANSVQMRVNVWDFFMVFGTLQQQTETQVEIRNFQGIYLSPQQAKALLGLLQQNVVGYESAFGEIKLDPRMTPPGPVH